MDDIQAAKSVIKKLSALRATLLDEEQFYLDNLVMASSTREKITGNSTTDSSAADDISTQRASKSGDEGLCAGNVTPGKITWNGIKEIYELD